MGLLSLAIWLPIVVGTLLLAFGRNSANVVRWVALLGSIASFVVTLPLYTGFQNGTSAMQFVEKAPWIERFNINYHLGVDGISLWLVLLTAFITVIVVISACCVRITSSAISRIFGSVPLAISARAISTAPS